jgi:DNA-directed RNA polymerase specialized sigma24 family protein
MESDRESYGSDVERAAIWIQIKALEPGVRRRLWRLRLTDEIRRDLVQEVLAEAWYRCTTACCTAEQAVMAATRAAEAEIRQIERHEASLSLDVADETLPETVARQRAESYERRAAYVHVLLASLDDRSSCTLRLMIMENRSAREAAEEIGITEGFARTIKSRALAKLRKVTATSPPRLPNRQTMMGCNVSPMNVHNGRGSSICLL